MSIDNAYNTKYNLWARPISGSWNGSGNPYVAFADADSTLNAGNSENDYGFIYTSIHEYHHGRSGSDGDTGGRWVEIDGTGLGNGSERHGDPMNWSRQYWIEEWDGVKPLRFFLTYRNNELNTYYDYCYYAGDTFTSTYSIEFNKQPSSNTPSFTLPTITSEFPVIGENRYINFINNYIII